MQYVKLTDSEIAERLKPLNNWQLSQNKIAKDFSFKTFKEAIAFVNKIADIAEQINHHPDIVVKFRSVSLSVTTHFTKCLTDKDFELAGRIDDLLKL